MWRLKMKHSRDVKHDEPGELCLWRFSSGLWHSAGEKHCKIFLFHWNVSKINYFFYGIKSWLIWTFHTIIVIFTGRLLRKLPGYGESPLPLSFRRSWSWWLWCSWMIIVEIILMMMMMMMTMMMITSLNFNFFSDLCVEAEFLQILLQVCSPSLPPSLHLCPRYGGSSSSSSWQE